MASFSFQMKSGGKGCALSHSRYVARQGYHAARGDLVLSGHGNLPAWTGGNPEVFWRAADEHERANGATYRELVIALPNELTGPPLLPLVSDLVHQLVGPRSYQYAVHSPRSSLQGEQNLHMHLMYSDRMSDGYERSPEQTFARFNAVYPWQGGCRKMSGGRTRMQVRDDLIAMRKLAADIQNAHLARQGYVVRVDHRSLREQGRLRAPERHLGPGRVRRMSGTERAEYTATRDSGWPKPRADSPGEAHSRPHESDGRPWGG
ncbi:MobA/MobL family protein [Pseudoxanthomonas mexicana]|uniref:MobA/MobL family protein n=1 Tax=Pseudoxanthomonas mexicana TaxID=128785 RepID=UPI003CE50A90